MQDEFRCGFSHSLNCNQYPRLLFSSQIPSVLYVWDSKLGFPLLGSYFEYDLFLFFRPLQSVNCGLLPTSIQQLSMFEPDEKRTSWLFLTESHQKDYLLNRTAFKRQLTIFKDFRNFLPPSITMQSKCKILEGVRYYYETYFLNFEDQIL